VNALSDTSITLEFYYAMLSLFANRKPAQRLGELKKLALFVDLSRREVKIVDGFMHERRYLQNEVIFDAGEEGQAIYFILAGKVLICPQGLPEKPIATLECGNFFGELALLDDASRMAQARAAEDCTLAVLFRGDFLGLMTSHALIASKIALQLARHLGMRLRASVRNEAPP
jgi:CRP-like cAMP-binding protein